MFKILPLTQIDTAHLRQLTAGYTSPAKYAIRKTENDSATQITLDLQPLDPPYIKQFPIDADMEAHYREVLAQEHSLGAYAGETLIGLAIAEKNAWNRTLWMWEFHIDPAYHGQGIGRALMEALAQKGREAGCRVMVCETQNTNVPAIRFYRKLGFEVGGIDLSYYTNQDITSGEVAVFMKRKLED